MSQAAAATSTEHFISTSDGLELFVRDYTPEESTGRAPVLCLHGLTRNSKDFESIAPMIAGSGRRVLAADMRGRGRSDRDPDWSRYQGPTYANDVVAILGALGIEKAVFFGTSMGGIITMIAATIAPRRIAAAILNDIGPVIDPSGAARIGSYVGKQAPVKSWTEMTALIKAAQGPLFPGHDEPFWQAFARRVAREEPDGTIAFDYDPAIAKTFGQPQTGPAPDLRPLFAALAKSPVLVLRGATSDILSPDGVAEMRAIKPDLTLAEIPGVGHAPTLDEPEARTAIASFLARVP